MRFDFRLTRVILVVLLSYSAGCRGGNSSSTGAGGSSGGGSPTIREGMTDLAAMLKELETNKKKLPGKLSEMEPYEPIHQGAYLCLAKGEVIYIWGVPLVSGSSSVIAYEKKVETEGGLVLFQDGTVKVLSSEVFKSTAKAKK